MNPAPTHRPHRRKHRTAQADQEQHYRDRENARSALLVVVFLIGMALLIYSGLCYVFTAETHIGVPRNGPPKGGWGETRYF